MRPLAAEWVCKAEEDFAGAKHLARVRKQPMPNLVCYLCQQCAEKYLKARLQEAGVLFPKTHNLEELLDLLLPVEPLWESLRPALAQLTDYAVEFRYPGENATEAQAKRAVDSCGVIRQVARRSLGLESGQQEFRVRERPVAYRTKRRKT